MRITALVVWAATAGVGLYLLSIWLTHRGDRQQGPKMASFPAILIVLHPVLALTGLGLWSTYVLTSMVMFAWMAFGVLCGSALLGFVLLARWLSRRRGRHARGMDQQLPRRAVAVHAALGVTTFVLVLITATVVSRA